MKITSFQIGLNSSARKKLFLTVITFAAICLSEPMRAQSQEVGIGLIEVTPVVSAVIAAQEDDMSTQMGLIRWFMGARQINEIDVPEEVSSNSKKNLINWGATPNRILSQAFLKKAIGYYSTTV